MSVIIDTTKSELEAVIRYARIGANNCMIANSWEVTELVRCRDCRHYRFHDGTFGRGWMCFECNTARHGDDYCSRGERRSE